MRWRRVAIVAGVVAAIGIGAAATSGLFVYHDATKIDRTNPKVVTDEYLRAALVRKDAVGAELYACSDRSKLSLIQAFRADLDQREQEFGVTFLVDWAGYRQDQPNSHVVLTTDLTVSGRRDGVVESKWSETWKFVIVEEGGWRVCGAERIALPSPSPSGSAIPTTAP